MDGARRMGIESDELVASCVVELLCEFRAAALPEGVPCGAIGVRRMDGLMWDLRGSGGGRHQGGSDCAGVRTSMVCLFVKELESVEMSEPAGVVLAFEVSRCLLGRRAKGHPDGRDGGCWGRNVGAGRNVGEVGCKITSALAISELGVVNRRSMISGGGLNVDESICVKCQVSDRLSRRGGVGLVERGDEIRNGGHRGDKKGDGVTGVRVGNGGE
jgi:hypothetical protein